MSIDKEDANNDCDDMRNFNHYYHYYHYYLLFYCCHLLRCYHKNHDENHNSKFLS